MRKIALLILIPFTIFAVKVEEIIETSRYNLDSAVSMFQDFIAENPDSPEIDELGKFIYAKLELSKIEAISDAVIEEDFEKLLDGIVKLRKVDEKTLKLLKIVFPDLEKELKDKLENLDRKSMYACNVLNLRIELDPEITASNLVEKFKESSLPLDLISFRNLKCVDNMNEILREVEHELETFEDEGHYMFVYSISKGLGIESTRLADVERYVTLMERIEMSDPNSMGLEDYRSLLEEYNSIDLKKDLLKEKLSVLAEALSRRGIDLSKLCDDEKLCPSPKVPVKISEKGDGIFKYTVILGVLSSLVVVSIVLKTSKSPKRRLKRLQKRINKDPLNPDLHIELAQLYEELGMMEEAMKEYRMASKVMDER